MRGFAPFFRGSLEYAPAYAAPRAPGEYPLKLQRLLAIVVTLVSCAASAVRAETLEEVKQKISDRLDRLRSVQARLTIVQDVDSRGSVYQARTEGLYEIQNKGARSPFRSDMKVTQTLKESGGGSKKAEFTTLSICDGEFVYTLQEGMGRRSASKGRVDPARAMFGDKAFLENLQRDYNLKLLADDYVDGTPAWVIEATPKDAANSPIGRMNHYFHKDSGLWVKAIGRNREGKVISQTAVADIKLNVEIPASRFEFHPPPGVEVVDLTGGSPARPDGARPAEPKAPVKK